MKQKSIICARGGTSKWGVNSWETYAPVVDWISVRSLLAIASVYGFPSRSIEFLLAFTQDDLDVDVFVDIPVGIAVDGNILEWCLKLNKSLYEIKQASSNLFDTIKTGL